MKPPDAPLVDPRSSSTLKVSSRKHLNGVAENLSGSKSATANSAVWQQASGPAVAAAAPKPGVGRRCFSSLLGMATAAVGSSQKRRFFQLSADLTTLRWAWNKYVVLYYVDALTIVPTDWTITLHMVLDPGAEV